MPTPAIQRDDLSAGRGDDGGADQAVHCREHDRGSANLCRRPPGGGSTDWARRLSSLVRPPHLRDRLGLSPTVSGAGIRDRGCRRTVAIRLRVVAGPSRDRDVPAGECGILAGHGEARHAAGSPFPEVHLSRRDGGGTSTCTRSWRKSGSTKSGVGSRESGVRVRKAAAIVALIQRRNLVGRPWHGGRDGHPLSPRTQHDRFS